MLKEIMAQNSSNNKEKQPPVLFDKTQSIVKQLSSLLGGTLVAYWNNPRGSVCHDDVVALYELLEKLSKQEAIYLFIKSSGGNGQSALLLVNLLRQYCDNIVALVPLECASAATMIALGANEIRMGPMAYLTAVDTSLTHSLSPLDRDNDRVSVSLDELTRVVRLWQGEDSESTENPYQELFKYVHPLVIGAVDRAESLSIMLCKEILSHHIKDDKVTDEIASTLNSKYPSHSYPILYNEAQRIGLNVNHLSPEVNALLLELNELYSEMGQRATTDFDDTHAHGNEILNIWESTDIQVIYQQDKDWFYRVEERRWISLNDNSSWRRFQKVNGKVEKSTLHIA
jgi:hypothetical protein